MVDTQSLIGALKEKFPASILEEVEFRGERTVSVVDRDLYEICRFLRSDPSLQFDFLTPG